MRHSHCQLGYHYGLQRITFLAYTSDFDEVKQELHEIPAASSFFKLLVQDAGWYGLVHHPKHFGIECGITKTSTTSDVQDYWGPMIAGYCPNGQLVPAAVLDHIAGSFTAFNSLDVPHHHTSSPPPRTSSTNEPVAG